GVWRGAGSSRMGDRSEVRQECRAGEEQGRAHPDDRRRPAYQEPRRMAGSAGARRRAVQPGERHRRARGNGAVPGVGAGAAAAGRRPEGGGAADHLRSQAALLDAASAKIGRAYRGGAAWRSRIAAAPATNTTAWSDW